VIPRFQYHATTCDRANRIARTGIALRRQPGEVRTYAHSEIGTISTANTAELARPYGECVIELRVKKGAKYLNRSYPRSSRKGETLEQTVNRWIYEALSRGFDGVYVGQGIQGTVGNQTLNPSVLEFVRMVGKQNPGCPIRSAAYGGMPAYGGTMRQNPSNLEELLKLSKFSAELQAPKSNPAVVDHYEQFHGAEPDEVVEGRLWVPGPLVCLGKGVDVGYGITDPDSEKEGKYVHDFESGVKIYRRAKPGELADKIYSKFPTSFMVLGDFLGLTYKTDINVGRMGQSAAKTAGKMKEIKGSSAVWLAVGPDKKTLVAIHRSKGVLYVMKGGKMHVKDWIYK